MNDGSYKELVPGGYEPVRIDVWGGSPKLVEIPEFVERVAVRKTVARRQGNYVDTYDVWEWEDTHTPAPPNIRWLVENVKNISMGTYARYRKEIAEWKLRERKKELPTPPIWWYASDNAWFELGYNYKEFEEQVPVIRHEMVRK